MARPKTYHITLTDNELKHLKSIIQRDQTSRTVRCRCQIIIDLDEAHGKVLTHEQSARLNGVCPATVTNTVKLFTNEGINGIVHLKRSVNSDNAHRKLDGGVEARTIEITCSPAPKGHARWTLRLLEEKARIELDTPVSKNAIRRALKKTGLDITKATTGASPKRRCRIRSIHGRCPRCIRTAVQSHASGRVHG